MNKELKQRQAEILSKYPSIFEGYELLCTTRCEDIINKMLEGDADYQVLTQRRADTSQIVLDFLNNYNAADKFESYSDAVHAEEIFELGAVYREAFLDAVEILERNGLLKNP